MLKWADRIRSANVDRWHSVATGRKQNLAEHHWSVTQIAMRLAKEVTPGLRAEDMLALVEYTLNHDLPEILSGDLNSVLRARLRALGAGAALKQIEDEIFPELMEMEAVLVGTPLKPIAKLADIADAIVFIRAEGEGNRETRIAREMVDALKVGLDAAIGTEQSNKAFRLFEKATAAPMSHGELIEQGLIAKYLDIVADAGEDFPDCDWPKASAVLDELLDNSTAHLDYERNVKALESPKSVPAASDWLASEVQHHA